LDDSALMMNVVEAEECYWNLLILNEA